MDDVPLIEKQYEARTEPSTIRKFGTHALCLVLGVAGMAAYQGAQVPPSTGSTETSTLAAVGTEQFAKTGNAAKSASSSHKIVEAPMVSGGGGSSSTSPDPEITYKDWSECTVNCGGDALVYPTTVQSVDGNLEYTLRVTKGRFEGPISYTHRAYNDGITGPTFVVRPGDEVKIHLKNELEYPTQVEYSWTGEDYTVMTALGTCEPYGQPNVTSLHFHGMLLPTTGLGDGPFRMANPGETITYHFKIDDDHPSGTFWYHSHYGMSHSLQTSGLMGGAFVVLDDDVVDSKRRLKSAGADKGAALWNEIQKSTQKAAKRGEDVMLFQWGSFSSSFGDYNFLAECSHSNMPTNVVSYDEDMTEFGIVNGVYLPEIEVEVGKWHKWRMINGAAHRYVGMYNIPETCDTYLIASDGVYFDTPRKVDYVFISMGSRVDILMKCTETGKHTLESGAPDTSK